MKMLMIMIITLTKTAITLIIITSIVKTRKQERQHNYENNHIKKTTKTMPLFASRVAMFSKHTHSRYRCVPSFLCCLELPFVIQTPKKGSNSVFLSSIFRCEIHAELRETGIWVYIYISFFLFFFCSHYGWESLETNLFFEASELGAFDSLRFRRYESLKLQLI